MTGALLTWHRVDMAFTHLGCFAAMFALVVGCGPQLAEIPPTAGQFDEAVFVDPVEASGGIQDLGGGVRAGFVNLGAGDRLMLHEGSCDELLVFVIRGEVQDGQVTRSEGTLIRTLIELELEAANAAHLFVALKTPERCAPADDIVRTEPQVFEQENGLVVSMWLMPEDGGELSFSRLDAPGGLDVPEHTHESADEILAFVDGTGTMLHDAERSPVQRRWIVRVPAGQTHGYESNEFPLSAYQLYSGRGPEARFVPGGPVSEGDAGSDRDEGASESEPASDGAATSEGDAVSDDVGAEK